MKKIFLLLLSISLLIPNSVFASPPPRELILVEEYEESRRSAAVEIVENVPIDKVWTITFSKEVDYDSAREHIVIEDVADGTKVPIEIRSIQSEVKVNALEGYQPGREYVLKIVEGLKEANGNSTLKNTVLHKFRTIAMKESTDSEVVYRSGHFEHDYFEIVKKWGNTYILQGKTKIPGSSVTLGYRKRNGKKEKYAYLAMTEIDSDRRYQIPINKEFGKEDVSLSFWIDGVQSGKVDFIIEDGIYTFPQPEMLSHNLAMRKTVGDPNDPKYLDLSAFSPEDLRELQEKAAEIVGTETDPYEKTVLIHDWVANNIYYDYDAYHSENIPEERGNAMWVLRNRMAVCEGYTRLFNALLRTQNIPCVLSSGVARHYPAKWSDMDQNKSNHAWSEVYVDGRWILVDVTWDSMCELERGVKTTEPCRYTYFDPIDEVLADEHRILEYESN